MQTEAALVVVGVEIENSRPLVVVARVHVELLGSLRLWSAGRKLARILG